MINEILSNLYPGLKTKVAKIMYSSVLVKYFWILRPMTADAMLHAVTGLRTTR